MPIDKRSHTIEDFFSKKKKANKDASVSTTSNDISDLINLQVDNAVNLGTLTINSQTKTTSNNCFDMCAVSRSIENILDLVQNSDDDTLPSATTTALIPRDTMILLDIGSDLREIKRVIEQCDNLIKQTTEIDSSREKILDRRTYVIKDSREKDIINRDSGALIDKHKFSDDELRYLASKGPFQPLIDFPVNEE